jgi:hypothetical protein
MLFFVAEEIVMMMIMLGQMQVAVWYEVVKVGHQYHFSKMPRRRKGG